MDLDAYVAAHAGVSVQTVSNALNNPALLNLWRYLGEQQEGQARQESATHGFPLEG